MKTVWMNETEVSKAFSDKVAEQFSKGLVILPETMSGTQGELAKVDFIDGNNNAYRVMMYHDTIKADDNSWFGQDAIVIEVRVYDMEEERIERNFNTLSNTLWNGHGETVEKIVYYRFTHGNNSYQYSYTTNAEYAADMKDTRKAKREWGHGRYYNEFKKVSAITPSKKLVDFIRKNGGWGYGNTKLEMIDWVEKIQGGYRVHFTRESNKNAVGFCAR